MTPFSPRLLKGGLVQLDPRSGRILRVIALQYNPDTLTRTLQPQAAGGEGADRSQALRLRGSGIETIKLEAEIDATDALEEPGSNRDAVEVGIHPQLAALEALAHPRAGDLQANDALAAAGVLEVLPLEAPLTLFVWGAKRVLPVRLTSFSVTETQYDPNLNPIQAEVSLGLRVLTYDDLGLASVGGALFMAHQVIKEVMATVGGAGNLGALGTTISI